ncbi:MAG: tetratricopeptide repeat protein [Planctomycetales bacterium]|nr:tetratricopeptide repeat protein [Planctomycetales bacterium]
MTSGIGRKRLAISLGVCPLLVLAAACIAGCGNRPSNEAFQRGRELVAMGRFDEAESELVSFEKSRPTSDLASRARFLRAKSRMGAGDFPNARLRFQETIDLFPDSEEARKSRYKIAMIDFIQGDLPAAQAGFQEIVDRADNIYVPEAKAMLGMLRKPQAE